MNRSVATAIAAFAGLLIYVSGASAACRTEKQFVNTTCSGLLRQNCVNNFRNVTVCDAPAVQVQAQRSATGAPRSTGPALATGAGAISHDGSSIISTNGGGIISTDGNSRFPKPPR
jgi:hypothetical protein